MKMNNNLDVNVNNKKKNNLLLISTIVGILIIILILCVAFLGKKGNTITYESPSSNLKVGEVYKLSAEYEKDNEKKELAYMSETPDLLDIDKTTGEIIAKAEGKATVRIYVKDNPSIYEYVDITIKGNLNNNESDVVSVTPPESKSNTNQVKEETRPSVTNEVSTSTQEQVQEVVQEKEPVQEQKPTPNQTQESNGYINFDKTSYTCVVGEVFDVTINAGGANGIKVNNYSSSNNDIAKIDPNSKDGKQSNTQSTQLAHVTCKKVGTVTLSATASTNVTTTVTVTVKEIDNGITFDKNNTSTELCPNCLGCKCTTVYHCKVGEKINVLIRSFDPTNKATVASFSSNDKSIASIERHPSLAANCVNCTMTQVTCKKAGKTKLIATNSLGTKGEANIEVTN